MQPFLLDALPFPPIGKTFFEKFHQSSGLIFKKVNMLVHLMLG